MENKKEDKYTNRVFVTDSTERLLTHLKNCMLAMIIFCPFGIVSPKGYVMTFVLLAFIYLIVYLVGKGSEEEQESARDRQRFLDAHPGLRHTLERNSYYRRIGRYDLIVTEAEFLEREARIKREKEEEERITRERAKHYDEWAAKLPIEMRKKIDFNYREEIENKED